MSRGNGDLMVQHSARRTDGRTPPRPLGSALLLWVLTFNMTILVLTLGRFPLFQTAMRVTDRSFRTDQALALAEAGLAHALWELQTNNAANLDAATNAPGPFGGWSRLTSTADCAALDRIDSGGHDPVGLYGMGVGSCYQLVPTNAVVPGGILHAGGIGTPIGTYRVWVTNHWPRKSSSVRVLARGFRSTAADPVTDPSAVTKSIVVDLTRWRGTAEFALASDGQVFVSRYDANSTVILDSYDSRRGVYGETLPDGSRNRSDHADLLTNALVPPVERFHMWIGSGSITYGDVFIAQGGTTNYRNWPEFWGEIREGDPEDYVNRDPYRDVQPFPLPKITIPSLGSGCSAGYQELGAVLVGEFDATQPDNNRFEGYTFEGVPDGSSVCYKVTKLEVRQSGAVTLEPGVKLIIDGTGGTGSNNGNLVILNYDTGRIVASGSNKIFVQGNSMDETTGRVILETNGGLINSTGRPQDLQIFVAGGKQYTGTYGDQEAVLIDQNYDFNGLVYVDSRDAKIHRRGGQPSQTAFGAIIAEHHVVTGNYGTDFFLHYDEALEEVKLDGTDGLPPPRQYRLLNRRSER